MSEYQRYINSLADQKSTLSDPLPVDSPTPAGTESGYDAFIKSLSEGPAPYVAPNQIGAGIDLAHAYAWESGNQLLQFAGFRGTEAQKYMEEAAKENYAASMAVPAHNFMDQVERGVGTLLAGAAPALVGGAVGAFSGIGTPLAAAIGAMTSANFNLADISFKTKDIQKGRGEEADYQITGEDLALSAGLGVVELAAPLKILRGMKAAAPALFESTSEALLKSIPAGVGTMATAGITEGVQDIATGVQAMANTGTEFTPEAVQALVDQGITEALVGGVIALPFASIEVVGKTASGLRPERFTRTENEDGTIDYDYDAPIANGASEPSVWKKSVSQAMGRLTDPLELELGDVPAFVEFREKLVQNRPERARMVSEGRSVTTQDIDEKTIKASLRKANRSFLAADEETQKKAVQAKSKGQRSVSDSEVQKALNAIWAYDAAKVELANTSEIQFTPRGDTYVPFQPDYSEIANNSEAFVKEAVEEINKLPISEKEKKAERAKTVAYAENIKKHGRFIHRNRRSDAYAKQINKLNEKLITITDPQARVKLARRYNRLASKGSVVRKDNSLEQDRLLGLLPDTFLQKWSRGTPAEVYMSDIETTANRIAHVNKWGAENERFWQDWGKIVEQATALQKDIDSRWLERASDIVEALQRSPTKRTSLQTKKAQQVVRSLLNVKLLPLAIIPSLGEMLFVFNDTGTATGLTNMGKVIFGASKKAGKAARKGSSLSDRQFEDMLNDLGMSMDEASNVLVNRIADDTFNPSYLENWFFKNITYLPQYTEMLRMTAAFGAEKQLIKYAAKLDSDNKAEAQEAARYIVEAGLDLGEFKQWTEMDNPFEQDYYHQNVAPATIALAEDVVVNPSVSKKPLWHTNEYMMLLAHMKSFATVFTNSVMRTWWDRMTQGTPAERMYEATKIFPLVTTFVAFQAGLAGFREFLKTGETERFDEQTLWQKVLTGASYLGGFGMGIESAHRTTFGQSAVESVLGPAAGSAATAASGVGQILSGSISPEEAVTSVIKFSTPSAPGAGWISDAIKEVIEGAE
jgi:hypothetical protein